MVNSKIRLIIFFAAKDGDLYSQQKQDQELTVAQIMNSLIAKFRLKLKKVGKTTKPFRYDLNQIPYDYTVQVTNKYHTIALISHVSKVMLKILQTRLQQYMSQELPDVQAGFRKWRRTKDQIANICWIIKEARKFQKNIYFCFIDYTKAFDSVDHNKLWKILQEMGIPDHPTCLLRNLYAGQEATVRPVYGTTDWFQIGKSVCQSYIVTLLI